MFVRQYVYLIAVTLSIGQFLPFLGVLPDRLCVLCGVCQAPVQPLVLTQKCPARKRAHQLF